MEPRPLERQIENYAHWRIDSWKPEFPEGRIERIYTHWSAHDYRSVFPAYHYCVATNDADEIVVVQTSDLRDNMREVRELPERPYTAHTRGRNSYAAGISIMAMEGSTPTDFGEYPLTEPLINALCLTAAHLAKFYNITIDADHVMSHAEAALRDGYFGTGPEQRWDIARLRAEPRALVPADGTTVGEELRSRMRTFLASL